MSEQRIIAGLTPTEITIVALRKNLGPKGIVIAGGYATSDSHITQTFKESLDRFDPKRKAEVILVVPVRQVVLKYLLLPSKNPDELMRMADLQALQGLPFSADEMVYTSVIGDTDERGFTRVIVVLARRKSVQENMDAFARLTITPSRCAVSSFGIAQWHARRFPEDANHLVMIVDLQRDGFEICVCKNRKLIFARGVLFSEGSNTGDDAYRQVLLTMETFVRDISEESIAKILVTGQKENAALIQEVLARVIKAPMVDAGIADDLPSDWDKNSPGHQPSHGSLCSLLGLALAVDMGPDLTPGNVHQARMDKRIKSTLVRLTAAFLFLIGAMALIINLRLSRQEEMLDHLRRKVNDSKKEAQGAKHRMGLFEALSQNRAQPLSVAQLVYELYKIIPETTALTNLQFIDGNLTIQGQSRESADVNVIQKALLDSPLFTDVTLQYANRPQRLAMEYTEFRIVCRVLHKGETRP